MRIRILQMFYYEGKNHYHVGDVVDVPESQAKQYINKGLAMQDKSMDGPSETKVIPPTEPVNTAPVPLRIKPKSKKRR